MTVSVVVVSYQTRELLLRCLGALRTGSADEVIVVDNASPTARPTPSPRRIRR
jgi:Predicted glycosyltransferases